MGYNEGRERYNTTKAALQGNEFGLRCLEKLVKFESYIPRTAIEEYTKELTGTNYISSGDEEDTPHYETDCIQSSGCFILEGTEKLDALFFDSTSDETRGKLSDFATNQNLIIEHSNILPFSILSIPDFDGPQELQDVEARIDNFIKDAGVYMRNSIIAEIDSYYETNKASLSGSPDSKSGPCS